jgi:hypothetical protein
MSNNPSMRWEFMLRARIQQHLGDKAVRLWGWGTDTRYARHGTDLERGQKLKNDFCVFGLGTGHLNPWYDPHKLQILAEKWSLFHCLSLGNTKHHWVSMINSLLWIILKGNPCLLWDWWWMGSFFNLMLHKHVAVECWSCLCVLQGVLLEMKKMFLMNVGMSIACEQTVFVGFKGRGCL